MSAPNSSRSGAFLNTPSSLAASTCTQSGRPWPSASLTRVGDAQLLLRLLAHRHRVAGLDRVRRDVDDLAVDRDRAVRDQLARLGAGRAEAHAVDDVVEARLEQRQQVRAGVALAALGFGEVAAELALEHAVHALDLLLLAQLQAEVGRARAGGAAVLAGLGVELRLVADRRGARSSGRGRCLRGGTAWPWGRGNVPRDFLRSQSDASRFRARASLASVVVGAQTVVFKAQARRCCEQRRRARIALRCDGASAAGSRCAAPASRRRSS